MSLPPLTKTLMPSGGSTLMTSFNSNHLPNASPPNIITMGATALIYKFGGGGTHILCELDGRGGQGWGQGKPGRRRWLWLGPVWRRREGSASAEVSAVEMTGFPVQRMCHVREEVKED